MAARWEHRRQEREAVPPRDARVIFRGVERGGRVLNLSPGGMMLESAIAPVAGEAVTVTCQGGASLRYFVRWALEGRIGLASCEHDIISDLHLASWWADGT